MAQAERSSSRVQVTGDISASRSFGRVAARTRPHSAGLTSIHLGNISTPFLKKISRLHNLFANLMHLFEMVAKQAFALLTIQASTIFSILSNYTRALLRTKLV